jgi:formyl-CoA transferase
MWTALGVVAALRTSEATGRGERVETSLISSLVGLLGVQGQRYLSTGTVAPRSGNANPVISPYGTFAAADGPLNIAPATDAMWRSLCREVGLPALPDDPLFATNAQRVIHRERLHDVLEAQIRQRPRAEWVPKLVAAGIPVGYINGLDEVFADAQVQHCRLVRTVEHPWLGPVPQLGLPVSFASIDIQAPAAAPPVLGQDSVAALRDCGFGEQEIEALIAQRVIVQAEPGTGAP